MIAIASKRSFIRALFVAFIISSAPVYSATEDKLDKKIQQLLEGYLSENKKSELVTAISVSVSLPQEEKIKNYVAGTVSNKRNSPSINSNTLFQIGSITKSFTAAIILQLEAEGKLNITQTIGKWLPQYPKWKNISIKSLLNMTSGILSYTSDKQILKKIEDNIQKQWDNQEIVDAIYRLSPQTSGWNYSDTNYILLAMIIEKATGNTFKNEIKQRLLDKYLTSTFYEDGPYPPSIMDKMAKGYFYGKEMLPLLYGKDVTQTNLSIAGAAGAIVSTPEDIARWVSILFTGTVLPSQQLHELKELVSMNSALPIKKTNPQDPEGFGLGIAQVYEPTRGVSWFYEGTTLGYRAFYIFTPCNSIIISIAMNSSPLESKRGIPDKIYSLAQKIYNEILFEFPQYKCQSRH